MRDRSGERKLWSSVAEGWVDGGAPVRVGVVCPNVVRELVRKWLRERGLLDRSESSAKPSA